MSTRTCPDCGSPFDPVVGQTHTDDCPHWERIDPDSPGFRNCGCPVGEPHTCD